MLDPTRGGIVGMATTSADRERTEMNLPKGVRERIDALRERMLQEAQAAGQDPEPFRDRGTAVAWLLDVAERTVARRAEVEEALAAVAARIEEAEEAETAAESRIRAAEQRETDLQVQGLRVQRQEGLSAWMLDLFGDLEAQGLDRMHVVQLAQVMRDSGLEPEEVAATLKRANIGGLLGWGEKLRAALEEAQRAHADLAETISAQRLAKATLEAEAQSIVQAIDQGHQQLALAKHQAQMAALRAEELGIYVDWLRSLGVQRIEDLPMETARVIAGTILLSAVGSRGDDMLEVPAAPGRRLIGGQILLSELPYILAPREHYEAMQQAHLRRGAMARQFSTDSGAPPAAGPQG